MSDIVGGVVIRSCDHSESITAADARTGGLDWTRLGRFAAFAFQFGLLVGVIGTYDLESQALGDVAQLAWCGFLVHYFLPTRYRLPFFALLSAASLLVVMSVREATLVLAGGTVLIALCHVPVAFRWRVTLVTATAALILAARIELIPFVAALHVSPVIWPIFASMFMFRLIVYLYDLRHHGAPFGVWHAGAYFFMLPNAAFPLFPVVDYKTFCRSTIGADRERVYQVGVDWLFRGVLQLLAYQVVYLFLTVDPAAAIDASDVLRYVGTTFLLYLRVSGTFHVIVGILHLFGFNLPETHHLYYLSVSFTDFWRRINIYWKDFLTKVVFYPIYFTLKRLGDAPAMAVATLVTFIVTWLLHSYQWLWLRGTFPLTWQDAVFWLGLGLLVVVNMLWERHRPPKRTLGRANLSPQAAVSIGVRTAGTFAVIAVLWAIWNTPTASLRILVTAARNVTVSSVLGLVAILAVVGIAGVLFGQRRRKQGQIDPATDRSRHDRFWARAIATALASLVVLVVGRQPQLLAKMPFLRDAVVAVKRDKVNRIDQLSRERGYYQTLGDVFRVDRQLDRLSAVAPTGWNNNLAKRLQDDFLVWEFVPSATVEYKKVVFNTNKWGMHDREYDAIKPSATFRIAMIGASHEVGAGVPVLENYENLTEDRLNRERGDGGTRRYELLNFSVDGYPPLQKLAAVDQRVLSFQPDLLLYVAHGSEFEWVPGRSPAALDELLNRDVEIPYKEVFRVLDDAGVRKGMSFEEVARRLRPHCTEIIRWVFRRLSATAQAHGSRAAVVLLEKAEDRRRPAALDALRALAQETGLTVVDLDGAFASEPNRESLFLAPWDTHPNARGHQLLAEKLYQGLVAQDLLSGR